jgi:hypothetical protein
METSRVSLPGHSSGRVRPSDISGTWETEQEKSISRNAPTFMGLTFPPSPAASRTSFLLSSPPRFGPSCSTWDGINPFICSAEFEGKGVLLAANPPQPAVPKEMMKSSASIFRRFSFQLFIVLRHNRSFNMLSAPFVPHHFLFLIFSETYRIY